MASRKKRLEALLMAKTPSGYTWNFQLIGGVVRVKIETGEDVAHLHELDQKLWTALSCPVAALDFNKETLAVLDTDKDGHIRVPEVRDAALFLTGALYDKNVLLDGSSFLKLKSVDPESENGAKFLAIASRMLKLLCRENTPEASIDIADIDAALDRARLLRDAATYVEWYSRCESDPAVLPYKARTAEAFRLYEKLTPKVNDYFMRCALVGYNSEYATVLDTSKEAIATIASKDVSQQLDVIASCPLAEPRADGLIPAEGVNPAWKEKLVTLLDIVNVKGSISQKQWAEIGESFDAYRIWCSNEVPLPSGMAGIDEVRAFLDTHSDIADCPAPSVEEADFMRKLLLLNRDFYKFLRNYVVFSDFYSNDTHALFNAGRLFIDQRCCKLCVKVTDMGSQADMASLSGMFLLYCKCVAADNTTMDIVAVVTDGSIENLRPGKNGVFYDNYEKDYAATVFKVVHNPINLAQAFWHPYRRFANFIDEKLNASAKEKEAKAIADLQNAVKKLPADPKAAQAPAADTKPAPFDIAKFAGIFAAIGMAVGYVGAFLTDVATFASGAPLKFVAILIAAMLCISGPSCFITWRKLRRRDLGPVLNANGWAINAVVIVNDIFGKTMTSIALYPVLRPIKRRKRIIRVILAIVFTLVVLLGIGTYFLLSMGL